MFRLLFVNMSVLAADLTPQHLHFLKTHHSTLLKRGKRFEALHATQIGVCALPDVFAENENAGSRLKLAPFMGVLLIVLVSTYRSVKEHLTALVKPFLYPPTPPYLTYQVIRI